MHHLGARRKRVAASMLSIAALWRAPRALPDWASIVCPAKRSSISRIVCSNHDAFGSKCDAGNEHVIDSMRLDLLGTAFSFMRELAGNP